MGNTISWTHERSSLLLNLVISLTRGSVISFLSTQMPLAVPSGVVARSTVNTFSRTSSSPPSSSPHVEGVSAGASERSSGLAELLLARVHWTYRAMVCTIEMQTDCKEQQQQG
eukprot:TRINITY_DN61014_c0_g1_i1.p1 TRINITY_DN61014_c0_g1~~TRINITY_DN61014_c0_g1_i1.p1  ORF type:complete len:113 (+),score=13.28 TRINITY_DN61014_c0_g1_i1:204-542(+)